MVGNLKEEQNLNSLKFLLVKIKCRFIKSYRENYPYLIKEINLIKKYYLEDSQ